MTIQYNYANFIKRSTPRVFPHFVHGTINRYLTRNPKLGIAIDLQKIIRNLTTTTEEKFTKKLDIWYAKYKDVLLEKSINLETQKSSYTHPKVVSAYKSLRKNTPYLFTYKKYPDLKINNTTNAIDGGVFSPMHPKSISSLWSGQKVDTCSCWVEQKFKVENGRFLFGLLS